nr:MAG TPA: hypothetical protein [Caudoviricetes sp.]
MTRLEILNLACDAALTKWGYYHERIEDLKKEGKTNELFEVKAAEWKRKLIEIFGMIIREGLEDGLKEGEKNVRNS